MEDLRRGSADVKDVSSTAKATSILLVCNILAVLTGSNCSDGERVIPDL
jgi:hypothetical protein